MPVAGLVGYTNAGKSTLVNALTGAVLYIEDKLFATLDPAVRRGRLEDGRVILFADTVGFIRHLPKQLLTAFQATLEEIAAADILIHVVDINHQQYAEQIEIVRRHLSRLDPGFERRELLVFNKIDLLESFEERSFLEREYPEACFVSAKHGHDLIALKGALARIIDHQNERVRVYLPYRQGALLEQIRRRGISSGCATAPIALSWKRWWIHLFPKSWLLTAICRNRRPRRNTPQGRRREMPEHSWIQDLDMPGKLKSLVLQSLQRVKQAWDEIDSVVFHNQRRVLEALQEQKIGETDFLDSSGYGYGDSGREKLERACAQIFGGRRPWSARRLYRAPMRWR